MCFFKVGGFSSTKQWICRLDNTHYNYNLSDNPMHTTHLNKRDDIPLLSQIFPKIQQSIGKDDIRIIFLFILASSRGCGKSSCLLVSQYSSFLKMTTKKITSFDLTHPIKIGFYAIPIPIPRHSHCFDSLVHPKSLTPNSDYSYPTFTIALLRHHQSLQAQQPNCFEV